MSAVVENHDHHHGPKKGLLRWLFTTNHKDIGTLYLWFSFLMFLTGGAMAMGIRAELFEPGLQLMDPIRYNQLVTMHGLIMIFGGVMPAFVGLANWLIPMQVGAPDMALPRMNNLSFWLLPAAFTILLSTAFMEGGMPGFGWTFYAPLSTNYPNIAYFVFAIHIMGISSPCSINSESVQSFSVKKAICSAASFLLCNHSWYSSWVTALTTTGM